MPDNVFVSTAPMKSAVSVTKLPLKWQFLSSRIRRSPTGTVGMTYALTSLRRSRNIIARRIHSFTLSRKRQIEGAGAGEPCLRKSIDGNAPFTFPRKCFTHKSKRKRHNAVTSFPDI